MTPPDSDSSAFLGVGHSASGKRWVLRGGGADAREVERQGLAISERFGVPEIVGRLISARGVDLDAVERFLDPTLKAELPDPSLFKDMDTAAGILADLVADGRTVGVFSDYDVDGGTSAAQVLRFMDQLGIKTLLHVPDRIDEGYGPNLPAIRDLSARGADVILCLDCGILAIETLGEAAREGITLIVVDHHIAEVELPPVAAVVNPNRLDQDGAFGHLAACGVTFLTLVALNRTLRERGWFKEHAAPDLLGLLDLVALGTVCDVVPLRGLNRAFVSQGLKVMAQRRNPGLVALSGVAGLDRKPDPYHLGYVLGPRINAGGRVGRADLGARLLSSNDPGEVGPIAEELDRLNLERRAIEAEILERAIEQAEGQGPSPVVVVSGEGWHPGVVGIVASRLKDRFNRPACVIGITKGIGTGSGRSVAGVGLGSAVIAAHQAGILIKGGGHAMAAGFSIEASKIDALRDFLAERILTDLAGADLVPELSVDGALSPAGATAALVNAVSRIGPFGTGNSEPRFVISNAKIVRADVVGQSHIRCILTGGDGGKLKAIAFRATDGPIGPVLLKAGGLPVHLAGHLRLDDFAGGDAVQLVVDDVVAAT